MLKEREIFLICNVHQDKTHGVLFCHSLPVPIRIRAAYVNVTCIVPGHIAAACPSSCIAVHWEMGTACLFDEPQSCLLNIYIVLRSLLLMGWVVSLSALL